MSIRHFLFRSLWPPQPRLSCSLPAPRRLQDLHRLDCYQLRLHRSGDPDRHPRASILLYLLSDMSKDPGLPCSI